MMVHKHFGDETGSWNNDLILYLFPLDTTEDFYAGDIVWAKAGRKEPFWPAIVIDPMTQAPELVLRSCIADAACVMFLGYAGNEDQRVCIM